jgi:hypothetical protein
MIASFVGNIEVRNGNEAAISLSWGLRDGWQPSLLSKIPTSWDRAASSRTPVAFIDEEMPSTSMVDSRVRREQFCVCG